MLHYKNMQDESVWKYSIDLRKARVTMGLRNDKQPFLLIEPNGNNHMHEMLDLNVNSLSHSTVASLSRNTSLFSKKKNPGSPDALKFTFDTTA